MRKVNLIAAIAVIALGALALSGCGGSDGPSQAELQKARQEGAAAERQKQAAAAERRKQAQLEQRINKLEKNLAKAKVAKKKKSASSGSAASSSRTSCGGNLYVGDNTTCSFAQNVASAWYNAGGGSVVVEAYSPVTGRSYVMQCTGGVPTVCRGGNNAVVYIR